MRLVQAHLSATVFILLILCSSNHIVLGGQSGRPDDSRPGKRSGPAPPPPASTPKIIKPPPRKPEPRAQITVTVQPADSRVMLDSQEASAPDSRGVVMFTNLTLASHRLVVRRTGYRDYSLVFTPVAGDNTPLNVNLDALPGKLHVVPSVGDALIEVKKLDGQQQAISLVGTIENLEIPAGDYRVTISKSGYGTVTRNVNIQPAQSLYLEPTLDLLEIPKRRAPERRIVTMPMTSAVETAGKYLVVRLRGASGEKENSGSIDVTASKATSGLIGIRGSLSGHPCEVEFVRMENVAEASLVETPGPSNQWSTVAIRVRPKDMKRLVHFVINWKSLEKSAAVQ